MSRIQLRRAQEADGAIIYEGEMFYDDQNRRIGYFVIGADAKIHFLPEIDDDMIIVSTGGSIAGRDNAGELNSLIFDWSNPDTLQLKHRTSGAVVASFGLDGTALSVINPGAAALANSRNLVINGGFQIKRNVGHKAVFFTNPGVDNVHMFAPNCLVWCTDTSDGSLSVEFDEVNVSTTVGIQDRVLSVTSSGNVSDSGVRFFMLDYAHVAETVVTIEFDFFAPAGESSSVRLLSSLNSSINVVQIIGTGAWERHSKQVYIPAGAPTWWALDALYEPSALSAGPINWKIGAVQINKGSVANGYERRLKTVEKNMVDTLYREGRTFVLDDATTVSVSLDSLVSAPNRVELVNPTDGNASYSNLDITGFEVTIPDLVDINGSVIKYAAMIAYPSS